jgi:hypothetical protein
MRQARSIASQRSRSDRMAQMIELSIRDPTAALAIVTNPSLLFAPLQTGDNGLAPDTAHIFLHVRTAATLLALFVM